MNFDPIKRKSPEMPSDRRFGLKSHGARASAERRQLTARPFDGRSGLSQEGRYDRSRARSAWESVIPEIPVP